MSRKNILYKTYKTIYKSLESNLVEGKKLLNTIFFGEKTEKPPLIILHGLLGSAKNWTSMAKALSTDRQVICFDQRNHGKSPWLSTHSYEDMAQDLSEILDSKVDVLGHSMGGKTAMALSLKSPNLVNRLIIADISPINYEHTQVSIIEALLDVDLNNISSRNEAIEKMDSIDRDLRTFLAQSINMEEKKWDFNLAVLKKESDKIRKFPEFKAKFYGDSLFIRGERSKYTSKSHDRIIKRFFANCNFETIKGTGHWLHFEKPTEFKSKIINFLNSK